MKTYHAVLTDRDKVNIYPVTRQVIIESCGHDHETANGALECAIGTWPECDYRKHTVEIENCDGCRMLFSYYGIWCTDLKVAENGGWSFLTFCNVSKKPDVEVSAEPGQ